MLWKYIDCSGEYRADINKRSLGDDSCPYCKNEQLLYGYNGVAQTESEE